MAGLWSRKFDYKNGETRVCKVCGETYHTPKPINKCKKCVNDAQRPIEEAKRAKYKKKEQYPLPPVKALRGALPLAAALGALVALAAL